MQLPEDQVGMEGEADWEVTQDGLYVATRGFLMRRGYCCANRCRNCPYINWRQQPTWEPIPIERARPMRVSIKAVAGAQNMLHHHQQELDTCSANRRSYHQRMVTHYQSLLKRWGIR